MKFCVIIWSLVFAVTQCDLSIVTEITENTDINTVIDTAINLSITHSVNNTNSFVRHRQDFAIDFFVNLVDRFNTRSLEIRRDIATDSQQVLLFYASNQILYDTVQRFVNHVVSTIATVTEALLLILGDKSKISIPTGDFIFHDAEVNQKRLRPLIKTLVRGCQSDFENSYRSMTSVPSTCAKNAFHTIETLYFDWGFKLADVYQDLLDAIDTEALKTLSNEEVLSRFTEFDEEINQGLDYFGSVGVQRVENAYNGYMSCMAPVLKTSRTRENIIRRRLNCLNLQTVGIGVNILRNKIL